MAEMTREEWLRAFCEAVGVEPPTGAEEAQLLELAAAVHTSERPAAPLACWAAGRTGQSPQELREIALAVDPA